MRRQIPMILCFLAGLYVLLQYFSPHPKLDFWKSTLLNWTIVIGTFSYALGIMSLWMVHYPRLRRMQPGWGFSAVTLIGFVSTIAAAMAMGKGEGTPFSWLYNHVMNPIQATMFSLLAFYIASAGYRAFRMRSILATLLLVSAVIVMLGRVPLGDWMSGGVLGPVATWLLSYPNLAAKRAIAVGVGFGGAAVAFKILIGVERGYLGGGDR